MILRDFVWGILHRNPLSSVDSFFNELLIEEIRLKSHSNLTTSQICDIAEQLQKLLATQSRVIYASYIKGLNSSCLSSISLSIWIIDSKASHYISYDAKSFVSLNTTSYMSVMTIDDTHMPLEGIGSISTPNLSFYDVYYISNLTLGLVDVS